MNLKKKKLLQLFCKVRRHRNNGNLINYKKTAFIKCKFDFDGNNNYIEANDSIFYNCHFYINGCNNKILIGSNCIFKNVEFWIEDDGNTIKVGDNSLFSGKAQIACLEGTNIIIGNDLLCSSEVYLRTSDSHSILNKEGKRTNKAKDITIGNKVWICQKAAILKGSSIPSNCVIAYAAIVTKSFDKTNCIIGGNPSKIIKEDIDWSPERIVIG